MDSTTIRRGVDLAWCLAALGAMWMLTRTLPVIGDVAPAAIIFTLAIVLLTIVDGERSPLLSGVPVMMLVLLMIPGERVVLLASGLVLASCFAVAGWRWAVAGRMSLRQAIVLLVAAIAPAVALPIGTDGLPAAVTAAAGAIAIVVAASAAGRVGVDVILLAYCAALVAPAVPIRSSLFCFVIAAMVLVLRRPGSLTAGLFVLLVLVAGKWYLPLLLAVAAGFAVQRVRARPADRTGASRAVGVPILSGIPVAAVSALAVAPDAWIRAREAGVASAITAALLAMGALIVQPSLATMYVVAALVCLVAAGTGPRWSPALLAFALVMSGLTAWSGSVSGAFPLPLSPVVVIVLALAASAAGVWRRSDDSDTDESPSSRSDAWQGVASAAVAGLAAGLVLLHPVLGPGTATIAIDVRIPAGDSVSLPLPPEVRSLRLEVAGGNLAAMKGGTVVGSIRAEPGGEARDLRIGDLADWGVRRREHYLPAGNTGPVEPAGPILGRGREAFLSGHGVVRLDVNGATSLTIEAHPAIGETGMLLVASVEVER